MRQKLTDLTIKSMSLPTEGDVKIWDTATQGFGIRLTKGSRSFFVMYGQKRRLKTLGQYPEKTLAQARKEALRYLVLTPEENSAISLTEARTAYLKECEGKNRPSTVRSYRFLLEKVDNKRLRDIKRDDIDLTNAHQVMAWRVFMNWCIQRDYIAKNPFAGTTVSYGKRERVLSDQEIKKIWAYEDRPFTDIVKVLLLTGLRRQEVLHLIVGDNTLTVPAQYAKNRYTHTIPSTPLVASLLPLASFNGWGKSKARMDKETGVKGYVLHDIRRTFATIHASIGTPVHVVEALLNHRSGTISGVSAVYNRYSYMQEMKTASLLYETHIANLVGARA